MPVWVFCVQRDLAMTLNTDQDTILELKSKSKILIEASVLNRGVPSRSGSTQIENDEFLSNKNN